MTAFVKGIGFNSALTLVFITLKLCGVINWSWWLLLLPTLISFGFGIAILLICMCFALGCNWDG